MNSNHGNSDLLEHSRELLDRIYKSDTKESFLKNFKFITDDLKYMVIVLKERA